MLETSALLPTDTKPPIPMPRTSAASSTASPMAPDWLSRDVRPGGGTVRLKVALNRTPAVPLSIPVQFGPTSLTPRGRRLLHEIRLEGWLRPRLSPRTRLR